MNALSTLGLAILLACATPFACAQDSPQADRQAPAAELADGEVKKIDKEAGKITLRHGEIRNLGMAAMTMVLRVKEPAMLDSVQVGDRIRFAAERVNGAVTVVHMQKTE